MATAEPGKGPTARAPPTCARGEEQASGVRQAQQGWIPLGRQCHPSPTARVPTTRARGEDQAWTGVHQAEQDWIHQLHQSPLTGGCTRAALGQGLSTRPGRPRSAVTRCAWPALISPSCPAAPAPTWRCSGHAVVAGLGEEQYWIRTTEGLSRLVAPPVGWNRHPKGLLSMTRAAAPPPRLARNHHRHPHCGAHLGLVAIGLQAAVGNLVGC
mmetsp:Transcript_135304/g.306097  ORF Transcript_135304/g.306097 Transcript_135304/m.306097 type:complete len:212 (-) Transcript_135304:537-1172(-)